MAKALFDGVVVAESDKTEMVEGNHYFPPNSIKMEYFHKTETHTSCPWKGTASYYTIKVGDNEYKDAAWVYPEALPKAVHIKDHIAFWKGRGVTIEG